MASVRRVLGVRARAVLMRAARLTTIVVATLLLCALALLLCVNTPLARLLIADAVNRSLSGYFCGQMTLDSIGSIGLSGVHGVRMSVIDSAAHQVISLDNLSVRAPLLPTVREIMSSRGAFELTLGEVAIERVELHAQTNAANELNLQHVFRICAPPSSSARAVHFSIKNIRVEHLLAHLQLLNLPAFDAELKSIGGRLTLIPGRLAVDVEHFRLATRGLANGADVAGTGDIKLVLPLANPSAMLVRSHWSGRVYGTELSVEAQWLAGLLRLGLDTPHLPAQTVRRFWRDFPEGLDTSVHADVQGTPPEFALQARVGRGSSVIDVKGQVNLGEQRRANLHAVFDSVDLQQVLANAPQTSLNASADISAQQDVAGLLTGDLRMELAPNRLAGIPLPPSSVEASFLHIPRTKSTIDARIAVHEVGAPTQLTGRFTSDAEGAKVTFKGATRSPRLDRVPRLLRFAQGNARAEVNGTLDFTRGTLSTQVSLDAVGFHRNGIDIGQAHLRGSLRGLLLSPHLDVDLGAHALQLAGLKFTDAKLQAQGPIMAPRINAWLRAENGARVSLAGKLERNGLTIRDFVAAFEHGNGAVSARADVVRVRDGGVVIEALHLEGLGEAADLDLEVNPRRTRLRVLAKGLDLARVARITQTGSYGGALDLDAAINVGSNEAEARVAFSLTHAELGRIRDWSAQGEVNLQDQSLFAHLRGDYGKANWVELQTDAVRLDGPGDALADWKNWSGGVGIDARGDVAELAAQLPKGLLPMRDLAGKLGLRADIVRAVSEDQPANVTVSVQGTRLGFALPPAAEGANSPPSSARPVETHSFRDIDATLGLAYDGHLEQTRAKLQLTDGTGVLATLDASAEAIPWRALTVAPLEQLMALPFAAQLQIPRRSAKSLPGGFWPARYAGDIESRLVWQGTLAHPNVGLETRITQARIPRTLSAPVDVVLLAQYDGERVAGNLKASLDSRTVLDTDLRVDARLADWLVQPHGQPLPWEAAVRARLLDFPLDKIRVLGNSEVTGALSGELDVEGLHRDARAHLKLETSKLRVRDLTLTAGSAQVVMDGQHFDARVRLEENSAYAEARLSGTPKWGDALLPSVDDAHPERAALSTQQFRIATLLPLTGGLLSELDGRLNADLSAEVDRRAGATRLSGVATLHGGLFELAAGGGEFHNIEAQVAFKPDGSMELKSMTAQGVTGSLQLTARTRFDGVGWASSEAHLFMPANSPIPLTMQGAGYGTMFGQVDVLAVRAANGRDVLMDVDVPSLSIKLPVTTTRTVQPLQPLQSVRFGSRNSTGAFEPLPVRRRGNSAADANVPNTRVTININLGKDVKIARGNSLEVTVVGHPQVTLADDVTATGQIQLVRGFLDIEGKRFEIEQGTVSFVGDDLTNPQADVTAAWSAADGTVVYADFSGPLRSGKVTLRSDPPLAKNDIMALLVFGRTDSALSTPATQTQAGGSNVIGVAQGAATQPINHALQDYGLSGVSTRIDTSNTNPRPEVEVRIARDIALQIAWVLGTPPPGSNPDRTLFVIDWQFFRRWSLETTVGDAGTSIADVVWQYGY